MITVTHRWPLAGLTICMPFSRQLLVGGKRLSPAKSLSAANSLSKNWRLVVRVLFIAFKNYNVIIIGAGNLGQAIANYTNFEKLGFEVLALFDINPKLIGVKIRDIPVLDIDELDEFISEYNIDIAIICAPKDFAQKIADKLNKKNVKGIWNFAPTDLNVSEGVIVENVNLSESLLTLSYLLNEKELLSG